MDDELKLFDDLPLFEKIEEKQLDEKEESFGHGAYANTLHQIVTDNNKPLTIGLFGEWGTGKSTVINILQNIIQKDSKNNILPVIFNAWRHQDDSFRRQLLISVADKVYGEQSTKYKDLTSLVGLSECIAEAKDEEDSTEKLTWYEVGSQLLKVVKWLFFSPQKAAKLIRIAILIYVILLSVGIVIALRGNPEVANFLSAALLLPVVLILFGVVEKETKHRLIATLNINQPTTEKPRLSYPEQFEKEFIECVKYNNEKGNRLVVVVDDLDRCGKNAVIAALAVIKQFSGKSNCVFIVPCDEKQVLKAVNAQDYGHDYNYESLRKFFDVAIRMDKIPETDLHNYAKYLVEEWNLSPRLAEMAVYSGARDARKVKAFLNSFNTRYWMIKERFDKTTAERNILLIAKLTALQEGFPDFYKKVCKEPSNLAKLEEVLRLGSRPLDDFGQEKGPYFDVKGWTNNDETLERFLRYTSDINQAEIEDIIMGKRPELIGGISTGTAIQAALSGGKAAEFAEAVKSLDNNHADDLVEYIRLKIRDFEEQKLIVTLRIWINCVLEIFSTENIWESKDLKTTKKSLADIIVETITKDNGRLIKETSNLKGIESLLQITSISTDLANAIVQVYLKEPTANDAISYIGLFNRQKIYFDKKINDINSAIITALTPENEQLILQQLSTPEIRNDINDPPIPSNIVLSTIVQRLDTKDEAYNLNEKRIQIIKIYQNRVDMTEFIKKWNEMTKKAQSTPINIEKTNFGLMLDTLNEIGRFEKSEDVNEICPSLLQIWAHNGKEDTRNILLITFALIYPLLDEDKSKAVENAIVTWFKTRPMAEIKFYLEYLTKSELSNPSSEKREKLINLAVYILGWFVDWLKGQVNAFNDRVEEIVNLIVEWNHTLDKEAKLSELIETVIKDANDTSFEAWHKKSLGSLCDCLSEGALENLGKMVIDRIEAPQTARARRNLLLDILITKLSPKGLEGNETDKIFSLLWHDDKNVREPICEKFESLISKFKIKDFNRNKSVMAHKISSSSIEKTTQKANSVSVFLKNSEELLDEDKKMVLSMVPPLIHSTNSRDSIAIGLEMVEEIGEKEIVSQDIISGLEALSQYSDENLKERANKLLKKFENEAGV